MYKTKKSQNSKAWNTFLDLPSNIVILHGCKIWTSRQWGGLWSSKSDENKVQNIIPFAIFALKPMWFPLFLGTTNKL